MTTIAVRDFREHLSQYLNAALHGEELILTEEGQPVLRVVAAEDKDEQVLEGMAAEGLVRRAAKPRRRRNFVPVDLPAGTKTATEMLAEDRR